MCVCGAKFSRKGDGGSQTRSKCWGKLSGIKNSGIAKHLISKFKELILPFFRIMHAITFKFE